MELIPVLLKLPNSWIEKLQAVESIENVFNQVLDFAEPPPFLFNLPPFLFELTNFICCVCKFSPRLCQLFLEILRKTYYFF